MRRRELLERGKRLEHLTIGWNVIEAVVAIGAGWLAGSIALIGFGGDSVIETVAAVFVLRRLTAEAHGDTTRARERERRALKVIALTFFALSAYILYQAAHTLVEQRVPDETTVGLVLAALSLLVMPLLAWRKKTVGAALGSAALEADAAETFVCAYLSFTLLLGLGLHALVGWWWADPVAALLMVPYVVREGREALRGSRSSVGGLP